MKIKKLRDWLMDPAVRSLEADTVEFSLAHRQVLLRKIILRKLYETFYHECRFMDLRHFGDCPGKRLELGSGAGILKEIYPDMITSDLKPLPFVDMVLRAEKLPFSDNSLRAIYAINVFHHIPDPRTFFKEVLRVLHPGGGLILIEPFYGLMARAVFRNLHASEDFDPNVACWETSKQKGPFLNANQALSYIVFKRDKTLFENEFPDLNLMLDRPHTHLWYLVSGGVNFRQLVPNSCTAFVKLIERMLAPFNRWLALQHTIVLRKGEAPVTGSVECPKPTQNWVQ